MILYTGYLLSIVKIKREIEREREKEREREGKREENGERDREQQIIIRLKTQKSSPKVNRRISRDLQIRI